jgi:signal transduction histidine kinase
VIQGSREYGPGSALIQTLNQRQLRAYQALTTFLALFGIFTVLHILSFTLVPLHELVAPATMAASIALNVGLWTCAAGVWLLLRRARRGEWLSDHAFRLVIFTLGLIFIVTWLLHVYIAGSQSSIILLHVLATLVVLSWILPWLDVVVLFLISLSGLVAMTLLEGAEIIPYAPLFENGAALRRNFVDWRAAGMNLAIFMTTCAVVGVLVRRYQRALETERRVLEQLNERLRQETAQRRKAEEELADTVSALRRSNDELRQFAHVISHDLREPLNTARGFLGLLVPDLRPRIAPSGLDSLQHASAAMEHMDRLIRDLLDYARVGSRVGVATSTELDDVVAAARRFVGDMAAAADARFQIDALPAVVADENQLVRLFQNLFTNAIKFRRADTPLVIRVWAHEVDLDRVTVVVADNGTGFEQSKAVHIFGVFERLVPREQVDGTGIGLAICRRVAERAGGRIWAESTSGDGARFYVQLPRPRDIGEAPASSRSHD